MNEDYIVDWAGFEIEPNTINDNNVEIYYF